MQLIEPIILTKWLEELYRDTVDLIQRPSEIIKLAKMIKYENRYLMTTKNGIDGLQVAKNEIINSMINN